MRNQVVNFYISIALHIVCLVLYFTFSINGQDLSFYNELSQGFKYENASITKTYFSTSKPNQKESLPIKSKPISDELEEYDEKETKNSSFQIWKESENKHHFPNIFYLSSLLKIKLHQIWELVSNQKKLALFILYHSWKSFLS
jgi:hypothetical protein